MPVKISQKAKVSSKASNGVDASHCALDKNPGTCTGSTRTSNTEAITPSHASTVGMLRASRNR